MDLRLANYGCQSYTRKKEDMRLKRTYTNWESHWIAKNENCHCTQEKEKCKEFQNQHTDKNNANGKLPGVT